MTAAKGRRRRGRATKVARTTARASAKQPAQKPGTANSHGDSTAQNAAANTPTDPAPQPTRATAPVKEPEKKHHQRAPQWLSKVPGPTWAWITAATASAAGGILAAVIYPSSTPAVPASTSKTSGTPITALIDPTGSGPCDSPQTVVSPPGPVGKSIYGNYPGQPASGGWLNVLVQGDGGEPVTIESITAKVLSRQAEMPGTVLYSSCQGFSPSLTYVRLDLRAPRPSATSVPAPNPTGTASILPLPLEVTGGSPAQLYIEPMSGNSTVRWKLQIHWERGKNSGILTAQVSNHHSNTPTTVVTTVGVDGDSALCPEGATDTWTAMKGRAC